MHYMFQSWIPEYHYTFMRYVCYCHYAFMHSRFLTWMFDCLYVYLHVLRVSHLSVVLFNMPSPCLFPASMCDCHYEFMFPDSMCDCHYEFMFPASMCDCHYEFMFLTWMHYCHDAFMSSMVWGFIPIRWGIGVPIEKTRDQDLTLTLILT